jgi:uncharacterized protein
MASLLAEFPQYRCWVVVGVSEDTQKFGHKIYLDLKQAGYEVMGVHPTLKSLDGDPVYSSVLNLPKQPDVANVVVPPRVALSVIDDCVKAGIKRIWFQPGSSSDEVIQKATEAGLDVVYDACIMLQKHES